MSLVFAGHIPNDPHFVADIATQPLPKDQSPIASALSEIEGELYFMKPETVIFLTEHQVIIPDIVNMQVVPQVEHELFKGSVIKTDALFTSELKGTTEVQQHTIPLTIIAEPRIDDVIAAPIALMMRHIASSAKIVVLALPSMSAHALTSFGDFLKREIMRTERRVALFSTGRLCATHEKNITSAQTVSRIITKSIEEKNYSSIASIQHSLAIESLCDSIAPLSVLFSSLSDVNISAEIFAQGEEHGATHMVMNCILQ
ncbi:MAG: hypothetical protein KIH62_001165 [Candidatus Kerfeldbacteria bacterium]|nr:hypothetical protein [Candidatus Kerfeldbacteria bacterium]